MKQNPRILLIEDDTDQLSLLTELLTLAGYDVHGTDHILGALKAIENEFDLILSDWKVKNEDGLSFFRHHIQTKRRTPFILMTAYGDVQHAMSCLRSGVDDYLIKPFNKQQLLFSIEKTLSHYQLKEENLRLRTEQIQRSRLVSLIGSSEAMQKIYRRVERIADSSATVLITGESGTGKELAARAIHELSARQEKPFIAVNCAAIPESLFEAELFGAEKGAFTGADKLKIGLIAAAEAGTLFLDEIGELPILLQSKILRVLQEQQFQRLGNSKTIECDVRIIAATNRNLAEEVKQGRFREDLYYRLNIVPIRMPPLRERVDDILILTEHFLTHFQQRHKAQTIKLDKNALTRLQQHPFQGNVRELSNIIERIVLLCESNCISTQELEGFLQTQETPESEHLQLPVDGLDWEQHERAMLIQAMQRSQNNKTQAARLLNLSYKTFVYRLDKYDIK